jgi:hypothetical protein
MLDRYIVFVNIKLKNKPNKPKEILLRDLHGSRIFTLIHKNLTSDFIYILLINKEIDRKKDQGNLPDLPTPTTPNLILPKPLTIYTPHGLSGDRRYNNGVVVFTFFHTVRFLNNCARLLKILF